MEYGQRICKEICIHADDHVEDDEGDVLIFGHGVWNCFVAWALAGSPELTKKHFFVHLNECDGMIVNNDQLTLVPSPI